MCITLLAITTALAIDPVTPQNEAAQNQSTLMMKCIERNLQGSTRLARSLWQLLTHGEPNHDPCTWGRSVSCTDGILKTFVFIRMPMQYESAQWKIEMDWLPSSLEFVHLFEVDMVHGWLAARLPRDLRFLCYSAGSETSISGNRRVDLCRLPERMEELLVRRGWYRGNVDLTQLPRTMRLLIIWHKSVKKAFLRNAQLPDGLIKIVLYQGGAGTWLEEIEGIDVDPRVSNRAPMSKIPARDDFALSAYRARLVAQGHVVREDFKALCSPRLRALENPVEHL